MRMFRWLWRYNALLIAAFGTVAVIGVGLAVMGGLFSFLGRSDAPVAPPVIAKQAGEEALELRNIRRVPGARLLTGDLVTPNYEHWGVYSGRSGRADATRNIVFFELPSGDGKRLFAEDSGIVFQKDFVTADCRRLGEATTNPRGVGSESQDRAAALVLVVAEADTNRDRKIDENDLLVLGATPVGEIAWRRVAAGLAEVTFGPPTDAHCHVIARKGAGFRSIEFNAVDGIVVSDVELVLR
jgi:hypothetical protein